MLVFTTTVVTVRRERVIITVSESMSMASLETLANVLMCKLSYRMQDKIRADCLDKACNRLADGKRLGNAKLVQV